jgi:rhodanese-related sulfurtransferase
LRRRRVAEVSGPELAELLAAGQMLQVIDIREEAAFRAGHVPGAHHIPLQSLEQTLTALDPGQPTVVY